MKRNLTKEMKSASYCCEASETISVADLDSVELKRNLTAEQKSASYCCEASETVSVEDLDEAQ